MFLYLTSLASRTLDKLVPYLPKSPKEMSVAFIPTAADLYIDKPWVETDRQKLVDLGFDIHNIDIKQFSKKELEQELSNKDMIFVSGGNTTYLLKKAIESGFDEIAKQLVKNGTIYIGSSAGSVLAGPSVEVDTVYDHRSLSPKVDSYKGLGLVDFIVLPHADRDKYKLIIKEIVKKFGNKFDLRKLNDNQALLVKDGEVKKIEAV